MYSNLFGSNKLADSATTLTVIYSICITSMVLSTQMLSKAETEHTRELRRSEFHRKRDKIAQPSNPNGHGDIPANKAETAQAGLQSTTASGNVEEKLNCSQLINVNKTECSAVDVKENDYVKSILKQMSDNRGMLLRTLYVTLGVTGIVVVYFVVRSFWLRRKRTKSRGYGVRAKHGDHRDMEMEPLGAGDDDDDDDYTVFEVNGRKK